MITQLVIDWFSGLMGAFLMLIPPMPSEFDWAVSQFTGGMVWVASLLEPLGILLPMDAIAGVLAVFTALFVFWGAVLVFKAIMWAWGR